jgi:4-hydroxythreonine-4-phosphate dehydrogenase
MTTSPTIAVTAGEPAGIGPDLCVRLAERGWPARLVLIGDIELLRERARRLRAGVRFAPYVARTPPTSGTIEVVHFPLSVAAKPGEPDPGNAKCVLATLNAALAGCLTGEFAAMVTAPVQKASINDAGIAFSGHTEFLAERTGAKHVVMLLVGGPPERVLRVALATTHLPLARVPAAITRESLLATLKVVAEDLASKFGIAKPRIAVCGLNPHAGEAGHLGREEIDVIAPAIEAARAAELDVAGPLPADTVFVPAKLASFDCVVAMYHDQGLPVLKHASFGHGVNVTLGLPILRTSVDHGTALDLAADGASARAADPGSMFAAVELAIRLAGGSHHA